MNKSHMVLQKAIFFKASTDKVWDLLVNPKMTKQYMFGCEVLSDWKIGSPVIWKGHTKEGDEIVFVKGEVTEYDEGNRVSFTMFDPNAGLEDILRNYVTLTYELLPEKVGCCLIIRQGDYKNVDNAKQRFNESRQGWEAVVPIMKKLLNEG